MADGAPHKPIKINKLGYRILGALARAPQSGYDIVKSLVRFRPVNISQVYPILAKMEGAGLLASEEVIQQGKPNKKVYHLREDGTAWLQNWITEPTERPEHRDEFVGKVYSLWAAPAPDRIALLRERLSLLQSEIAHYADELDELQDEHGDRISDPNAWQFCRHILMSRRIALYREELRWCQDVMDGCISVDPAKPPVDKVENVYEKILDHLDKHRTKTRLYRWRFNMKTGQTREEFLDDEVTEFPFFANSVCGYPYRYSYGTLFKPGDWLFTGIKKYDLLNGTDTRFEYGGERYGSEPHVALRPNATAEDDGYIITIVTDMLRNMSECLILDAADIAAGPIASIELPERVCMGTHACWVEGHRIRGEVTTSASEAWALGH
ncbi:MAG: carotenoid oxygenase family protein [Pikeienuella sp.]